MNEIIDDYSIDDFLGGKVKLCQPLNGYRATSDAILLSAAVSPAPDTSVLDVGSGTGAVSLCIKALSPFCKISGIEIQEDLHKYSILSSHTNKVSINFLHADIAKPPSSITHSNFDYVVTNPPYFTEKSVCLHKNKSIAHHEDANLSLEDWLLFCIKRLKPNGTLALIHKADRLAEILNILSPKIGNIIIYPIFPSPTKPAKRVIITGLKNSKTPLKITHGITMYKDKGNPSPESEQLLRQGAKLSSLIPTE